MLKTPELGFAKQSYPDNPVHLLLEKGCGKEKKHNPITSGFTQLLSTIEMQLVAAG